MGGAESCSVRGHRAWGEISSLTFLCDSIFQKFLCYHSLKAGETFSHFCERNEEREEVESFQTDLESQIGPCSDIIVTIGPCY